MKTIIIAVLSVLCFSILYWADATAGSRKVYFRQTQKTKDYNSDTSMHQKQNHHKSSGKNIPQNRSKADSLNDQLKNNKTPGRVDTAQMR